MGWINDLWTNATTGSLTADQKVAIATDATQSLMQCKTDFNSPTCQDLQNHNLNIVNNVAHMDETCSGVLNVPVIGCIDSWGKVFFWAVGFVIGLALLYGFVSGIPAALAMRGKR